MTADTLEGFLVLDKPVGMSSMKALARIRVMARDTAPGAKSGHAGTLDPLATGILVIGIGRPATRLLEKIVGASKKYRTEIDLAAFSPSDDLEREPEPVDIERPPTPAEVESAMAGFQGRIMQAPPAFSAIKVDGKRAYQLARVDKLDTLPPRPVLVHDIALVNLQWPVATVDIHCGKGFYVRSLARDLGLSLGTGGYCRTIRRTAVGPFNLAEARTFADLPRELHQPDVVGIEDAMTRLQEDVDAMITPGVDEVDHQVP